MARMTREFDHLSTQNFERIRAQIGHQKSDEILKACLDYNLDLKLNLEKSQKSIQSILSNCHKKIGKSGQEIRNHLMFK